MTSTSPPEPTQTTASPGSVAGVIVVSLGILVIALVLFGLVQFNSDLFMRRGKDFSWENFNKVQLGMSMQEVEALIGLPFETVTLTPDATQHDPAVVLLRYQGDPPWWLIRHSEASLEIDVHGRVVYRFQVHEP